LRAKRAAWVDRHSAAGFIVPRIKLARIGMNPDGAFGQETFYGSHEAVVRAVAAGQADFGATWVQIDRGKIVGPWSRMTNLEDSVRVLATFGNIPSDVLAARADVDKESRKSIVKALKKIGLDRQARWILRDLFGTESFFRPNLEGYASLHEAVSLAYRSGWLQPSTVRPDELDVAKTLEIRPRSAAMASRINPDATDEAEVIEVIEPSNPGARPLEPLGPRWSE
jgi:phosphonate transport system substrate-binding protein